MHIGTARTALFNWLYARHCGGRFLVRIEDTDRERSTQDAVDVLFRGLAWLGLEGDEEPVFQSQRADRHREAALQLLDSGGAYRCWMTPDEVEAAREQGRAEGRLIRSPWRDRTDGPADQPYVVRFRGPDSGEVAVDDLVQGRVAWQAENLDDLVLLRSDGTPTYNLAVVVDDHDMGVTHVIRGDDHLNNAARQSLIYDALGWSRPAFAHIPLIHGPDGAKLSKRHGAQAVADYAGLGYLPEAMRNYLARLGWSHGDDEIFSDDEAIAWFDVRDVNRAPSRLDFEKLAHVNAHWIRQADDARLTGLTLPFVEKAGLTADEARIAAAIPQVKDRAKTLVELAEQVAFALAARPLSLDDKATGQIAQARPLLEPLRAVLADQPAWDADALAAALKTFAEGQGVGFGKFAPALRAALTGGLPSPDLGKVMAALGREESLARLDDALSLPT
ncbi:glutamate--tRNA ligase [Brevundimonas sp. 2R-24]|uniref:Glutamate--tRNA ligase n=1 Tax=Peiella sedimenti TaxID=3061083 RepID=A0ABT8SIU7_9CAUL|nr:glutamate--tRNA ligase [Caulobacteraceae bacterium XZ-24]